VSRLKIFLIVLLFLIIASSVINIFLLFRLRNDKSDYEAKISSIESEVLKQKNDKNEIRSIWEQTAANNDKLVIANDNLQNRVTTYVATVKKSIRFVNSIPQLQPDANEKSLKQAEDDINFEVENLNEKVSENEEYKSQSKQKIDALYINSNEDQPNKATNR